MTHSLTFDAAHDYRSSEAISVLVTLRYGSQAVEFEAFVDTGSTFCVFDRQHAEMLGIDVEAGTPLRIRTVIGGFDAYEHGVVLSTLGYDFDVRVYFAAHQGLPRNVLGRRGWLDQVRFALIESDGKMYLSKYDDSES